MEEHLPILFCLYSSKCTEDPRCLYCRVLLIFGFGYVSVLRFDVELIKHLVNNHIYKFSSVITLQYCWITNNRESQLDLIGSCCSCLVYCCGDKTKLGKVILQMEDVFVLSIRT